MDLPFGEEVEFSNQTLRGVSHRGLMLSGREFYDCVFRECNLQESVFRGCRFVDCVFKGCDLSLVQVPGSSFRGVKFEDSKLLGVNWTEAASVKYLEFVNSSLNYSTLMGLDLKRARLTKCDAREVDFSEADLSEADCTHSDFAGSRFVNTNLSGADFSGARNYLIDPRLNKLKGAKFSFPEAIGLLHGLDIILIE